MSISKPVLFRGLLAGAIGAGALALMTAPASAEVVCNRYHECWHARDHVSYPIGLGVVVHDDAWERAHHRGNWRWRQDHAEHGYYKNGRWHAF